MIAGSPSEIERTAEAALAAAGLQGAVVRAHGDVARVELAASDVERLADSGLRETILRTVRSCGFRFVAVDLGDTHGR